MLSRHSFSSFCSGYFSIFWTACLLEKSQFDLWMDRTRYWFLYKFVFCQVNLDPPYCSGMAHAACPCRMGLIWLFMLAANSNICLQSSTTSELAKLFIWAINHLINNKLVNLINLIDVEYLFESSLQVALIFDPR